MSTRQNCARFGAPTGSVNSFFINARKKWYSCEHSSRLLQKIITRGWLCLEVFSFMTNGVKASSMLTFCQTAYEMLGLFRDVEIITGLTKCSYRPVSCVTAAGCCHSHDVHMWRN